MFKFTAYSQSPFWLSEPHSVRQYSQTLPKGVDYDFIVVGDEPFTLGMFTGLTGPYLWEVRQEELLLLA